MSLWWMLVCKTAGLQALKIFTSVRRALQYDVQNFGMIQCWPGESNLWTKSLDRKDPYASALYQLDCMSSPSIVLMGHPEGGHFYIHQPNMRQFCFCLEFVGNHGKEVFMSVRVQEVLVKGWEDSFFIFSVKMKKGGFSARVKGGEDFLGSNLLG